jgi:very-short-patch-repair endonuclease
VFGSFCKKKENLIFCSHKCSEKYHAEQAKEIRICPICKKEFICNKSEAKIYCSMKCQGKWFSSTHNGENASNYHSNVPKENRKVICKYCKKEFFTTPYQIGARRYCSNVCSKLDNHMFLSVPHTIIDKEMTKANILHSNEVRSINIGIKSKYIFDIVINESNLIIEIMGDYWHCSPLKYTILTANKIQRKNIKKDIKRDFFIRNKMNYSVLYLWEKDIMSDPEKCIKLVELFISKNGNLNNYDSFNYTIKNGVLVLNNKIINRIDISDIKCENPEMDNASEGKLPPTTTE